MAVLAASNKQPISVPHTLFPYPCVEIKDVGAGSAYKSRNRIVHDSYLRAELVGF
jgi:hypothetical protein